MRLLLTDDESQLGASLARALATRHDLRVLNDPLDRSAATTAVSDREAVIHLVPSPEGEGAEGVVALDRATRGTYNLLTATEAFRPLPRLILVTSLRPFERYPPDWRVDESWAPRPTTALADLVPFLAEQTGREVARVRRTEVIVLRLGEVVPEPADRVESFDPRSLHVADAIQAVERALNLPAASVDSPRGRWRLFHVADGGTGSRFLSTRDATEVLGYAPRHHLTDDVRADWPREDASSPPHGPRGGGSPPRRVVIFGAGGPLGAVAASALAREGEHVLRLTDVRPMAAIAAGPPQSPGAPLPRPLGPPHEACVVDVTDAQQVAAAVEGMEAILNLTVMRRDPVEAFRVNLLGAWHVMRGAVEHGVRRVVHTGPVQMILDHPAGYGADFHLSPDAPSRPGDDLYFLSKFLGQEVVRVFAEEHGLEVPCLLFGNFLDPATTTPADYRLWSFTLSWEDAGEATRRALSVPQLPRPFQVLHVNADLPHGRYPNDAAKEILEWQPRDRFEHLWRR